MIKGLERSSYKVKAKMCWAFQLCTKQSRVVVAQWARVLKAVD